MPPSPGLGTAELTELVRQRTGWKWVKSSQLITDTSDWMRINRGDVLSLGGELFIVRGTMREPRFGIDDQPKPWVLNTTEVSTGQRKIIKTVFHEDFNVLIGIFKIRCFRSPEKEAKVLEMTESDPRFMSGYSLLDEAGNNVRVLDFIPGPSLFQAIPTLELSHRDYFDQRLPGILWKLKSSFEAIRVLHENGVCHGDIRNDHIIIESDSGRYRWIDFDISQNVNDFDLWSIGNVLNYAVSKGIITFKQLLKDPELPSAVKESFTQDDAAAFYEYRIMNLRKVFDYIPERLAAIMSHFTLNTKLFYTHIDEFLRDYVEMLEEEFPQGRPEAFAEVTEGAGGDRK